MHKIRILLADDHETVREGLKVILNAQPDMEVVAEASDGRSAVARAGETRPDIVIMDVSMPGGGGLEATRALRSAEPATKVLMLTRHRDDGYVQELLRAGASGYVLKQSRAEEVLQAIRAVANDGTYIDPAVAGQLVHEVSRRAAGADAPVATLSSREEEVLRAMAWGYSNKETAARLDVSVKTVETHKSNALQKLGLRNRVDVVRFALFKGWLREG